MNWRKDLRHLRDEFRQLARAISSEDILTTDEKEWPGQLRKELEERIALKEAELNDLTGLEAQLGDLAAMAASYAGGSDGSENEGDDDQ